MNKSKAINPKIFADISVFSSALPILAFLFNKKNWIQRSKWVCFFILLASVIADAVNERLAHRHLSNLWVINLYILIDSLLVFYFYYWKFRNHKSYKPVLGILLLLLLASWLIHNIFTGQFHTLDSWSNGIETISVIIFSVLFFYDQLIKPQTLFVYSTAIFWIIAGILIYKGGTFFLILYFNTLEKADQSTFANLYIINSAFLIIRNILFTVAFVMKNNERKKK